MTAEKISRYDFKVHPLAELFPPLPSDEFKKLKRDIELHGQIDPITLSHDGSCVLDGINRLRACKELGIEPLVKRFDSAPDQTESDFIWAHNVLRRHLSADQRAAIAVKWSDAEKAAARERQKATHFVDGKNPKHTAEADSPQPQAKPNATRNAIAEKANVSTHKIRQAEAVAKRRPDLADKVKSGEMTLRAAEKQAKPETSTPTASAKYRLGKAVALLALVQGFRMDLMKADPKSIFDNMPPNHKDNVLEGVAKMIQWLSQYRGCASNSKGEQ